MSGKKTEFYEPTPVPKSEFDRIVNTQHILMTGVIIVLFVGFTALLIAVISPIIDAWRFRATSYDSLVQKIEEQSNDTDKLKWELRDFRALYEQDKKISGRSK